MDTLSWQYHCDDIKISNSAAVGLQAIYQVLFAIELVSTMETDDKQLCQSGVVPENVCGR